MAAFWWQPADGSGSAVAAGDAHRNPLNIDLSPDGRTIAFNSLYDGSFNLESFALDSTHEQREVSASATETYGRFAPDGKVIAYQSDESGRFEVYLRSFPASGGRIQVSVDGGRRPIWSPDGTKIYFWEGSRLMSATVTRDPNLRVVSRQALFDGHYEVDFDISKDGTRFLMIESETSGLGLVVVPDWLTELEQLTSARKSP